MTPRRALITGITGQDGSYLAELLLEKGYEVWGLVRGSSQEGHARIAGILDRVRLLRGDLLDQSSLQRALARARPDEVYNLAAQSFVPTAFAEPVLTAEITGLGVTRLLEAVRAVAPEARFYQASSSELFGQVRESPQRETTPFHPRSPYGVAKLYAHAICVNYREAWGLYAATGILFNHESPRRGPEFVTRKVSRTVARIAAGLETELPLGNLEARRDWGWAPDYVRAMWLVLQHPEPSDWVVATGETHSVRELCRVAFDEVGLEWQDHVRTTADLLRPADVDLLVGDASRARRELGWEPTVRFEEIVRRMVRADVRALRAGDAARPLGVAIPEG